MSMTSTLRHRSRTATTSAVIGLMLAGLAAGVAAPAGAADTSSASAEAAQLRGDATTVVSSDGATKRVKLDRRAIEVAPAEGSGEIADSTGVELSESASIEGVPVGPESILGADNRFKITNTTSYPARATVRITSSVGQCTGWMIDDDTVATAGHCVHNGAWATSVRVTPGQNGWYAPYGSCTARSLHSVLGWTRDRNWEYDYAAIKLNCTVGNTVGWYGMRWTSASLNGVFSYHLGYPGAKPAEQWGSYGYVQNSTTRKLYYTNDTVGGNSGGPIYDYVNGYGPYGIAVHAYGTGDGLTNSGTRITQEVFNNYSYWRGL
jgi:glutamyl endopeptidase